jgi:hypothetical protein
LHSTRTKAFSAVGDSENTGKKTFNLFSSIFSIQPKRHLPFEELKGRQAGYPG